MDDVRALLGDADARWRIIRSYFSRNGWVSHQIKGLTGSRRSCWPRSSAKTRHRGHRGRPDPRRALRRHHPEEAHAARDAGPGRAGRARPHHAPRGRVRRLTYALTVTGNLLHEVYSTTPDGGRGEVLQRNECIEVPFFSLPCMLRSKACHPTATAP